MRTVWFVGLAGCVTADPCLVSVFEDVDGDGFGTVPVGFVCEAREGVAFIDGDCDDDDASVFPGAPERCDFVDDDCDGVADEGFQDVWWYLDADDDGAGGIADAVEACRSPGPQYQLEGGDCDDTDPLVGPGAPEVCDGIDNDCNGLTDDADRDVVAETRQSWFADVDGDSYGDPSTEVRLCAPIAGYVSNGLDCVDTDAAVNPDATVDLCDGVDNDCDGLVDFEDSYMRSVNEATVDYANLVLLACDEDADGYGSQTDQCLACEPQDGVAADNALDCDDTDVRINPEAVDLPADGVDANCDGTD